MQNGVHLLNYREIHGEFRSQIDCGCTRFDSLRDHGHGTFNLLNGPAPGEFQADLPVPAEVPAAREY
jgi:hypothetical protein